MPDAHALLAVAAGAAVGGVLRYLVTLWSAEHWGSDFPWGTLLVNLTGALLIGFGLTLLLTALRLNPAWRLLLITGCLGGYTTFSSYVWEALTLVQAGDFGRAALYVAGSNVLGLAVVWAGAAAAQRFTSS
jgi:CrcB protein